MPKTKKITKDSRETQHLSSSAEGLVKALSLKIQKKLLNYQVLSIPGNVSWYHNWFKYVLNMRRHKF